LRLRALPCLAEAGIRLSRRCCCNRRQCCVPPHRQERPSSNSIA